MVQTDAPAPLYPSARYRETFDGLLNPRRGATLPAATPRARLNNLSARARSANGEARLMVGASVAGEHPDSLIIRAVGPSLQVFGTSDPMPNPRLLIYAGAAVDIDLDDWSQTPSLDTLNASTLATGAFALVENSRDAALLASFSPGTLTAHAPPADGTPGAALLEIYEADEDASTYLSNFSARARVAGGENVLIVGLVTTGGNLRLLIRGAGPALSALGVADALQDPILEIYRGNERIAVNDNWSADPAHQATISAATQSAGAFPFTTGSRDAGVLLTLPPGAYTAVIRSQDGRPGIGLVDVYLVP
jgi:hypothetical protein